MQEILYFLKRNFFSEGLLMKKIGIAIIGYGYMGEWHYQKIKNNQYVDVICVFDTSVERRNMAKFQGLLAYDNVDNMFCNENVDAVLIATPNSFHEYYIRKAFFYNKHVICEKPVTIDSRVLFDLINIAKEKKIVFTGHFNRRWDNDFQKVLNICNSGKVGKINYIESRVLGEYGLMYGWRSEPAYGGGIFLDWAPHLIDQALILNQGQKVISVFATIKSIHTLKVDDYFRLMITFDNQTTFYIECGIFCLLKPFRWLVYGSEGTLRGNDEISVAVLDKKNTKIIRNENDSCSRLMQPLGKDAIKDYIIEGTYPCHDGFYTNFYETINGISEIFINSQDMYRVSKIMDVALLSAQKSINCSVII